MDVLSHLPQLVLASLRDGAWLWLAALALAAVLALAVRRWRLGAPRRRLRRTLARLGPRVLNHATIPDPVGGWLHVDHLVLTSREILVVDVKDYRGMLFGGEATDHWTQVVDGRSYRFENPLRHNAVRVQAVRALAGNIPVRGMVVFTDAGAFPRQRPPGVFMLSSLLAEHAPAPLHTPVPRPLQEGWRLLAEAVQ